MYINQLGIEKAENIHHGANPSQQQMMVGPIIRSFQTQSNKQIQNRKSYVQSEKRFNTEDKAKKEGVQNTI